MSREGIVLILNADRTLANEHSPVKAWLLEKRFRPGTQHLCKRHLGRNMDVNEHLDAHRGNYKNPTNGYYDPETGTFVEFGDYVPEK